LIRNDVLFNLAQLPELFNRLTPDPSWVEVVVFAHGATLLNSYPNRSFSIAELLPLGIDVDRSSSRAVLSSALDGNQLLPAEKPTLLSLFPDDAYFRKRISPDGV
jgi:hypothetical protein